MQINQLFTFGFQLAVLTCDDHDASTKTKRIFRTVLDIAAVWLNVLINEQQLVLFVLNKTRPT